MFHYDYFGSSFWMLMTIILAMSSKCHKNLTPTLTKVRHPNEPNVAYLISASKTDAPPYSYKLH
jgi:hypothetical protein